MGLFLTFVLLGGTAPGQTAPAPTKPEPTSGNSAPTEARGLSGDLMAMPRGKSTVIGGTISAVDPVSDRLTLNVFGSKPIKVLFDERTQVYRDGVKTNLRDLRTNDRASIETMLDGTTVFARSIHMLSQAPEGECRGQVMSYDPGTRHLTVNESLSREAIKLDVPPGVTIVREGQAASGSRAASAGDLVKGTLITARFKPDNKGGGIATQVAILATPGSRLTFEGNLSHLDLRGKVLAVADSQDDRTYKISFNPANFPIAQRLKEGARVKVIALFDGNGYVAQEISLD
jgi:Domain of unknown function (DUF5666)